jgi:hypothetical protein
MVYSYSSDDSELYLSWYIYEKDKSLKMDPATIGLLISMAPTVLDLLFGEGHIKESLHPQRISSKDMLAYGLEGYGEGYRYPPPSETFALLPLQTSSGKIIQRAIPVPTKKWAAAYFLNKRAVAKNPWVSFMRSKMGELRDEYYREVKKEKAPPRVERIRHRLMLEAIRRSPDLAPIENLSDEDLINLYYEGRIPPRRKKEGLPILQMPKK